MAGIDDLQMYTTRRGSSPLSVFRQLVSNGGIQVNFFGLVNVELKEDDLRRVHDIIHEIDDSRSFYQAFDDEIPKYMVQRIRSTRDQIHQLRRGVWANTWAREVVQRILHDLGDFLTKIERSPLPKNHHDRGFEEFENHALEMRLRIWTAVAHLVVVFGDAVKPFHLPPEILAEVKRAYDSRV